MIANRMSTEVARSTNLRGVPDLYLLGVPPQMQLRAPGPASFPTKFNGDCRRVWVKLFDDPNFLMALKSAADVDAKWLAAIMAFLDACESQGVSPFAAVTEQQKNDAARQYLQNGRNHLVRFVNNIGLFGRLKVQKAYREFVRRPTGLTVKGWATCKPCDDPTFEKWLTTAPSPRFLRSTDSTYVKHVQPNVMMWVKYVNKSRITIGFEITIGTAVSVPGKRLATRKEVDNFIDRSIWLPVIRANRFDNLTNRLF